jgi:hypothetical protein
MLDETFFAFLAAVRVVYDGALAGISRLAEYLQIIS